MIIIKTEREIEIMRRAGIKLARLLDEIIPGLIKPGVSAAYVEQKVNEYMDKEKCIPSFKGYGGFPYATCMSLNEEIVHGFALDTKIFKDGDIISVDCGVTLEGYVADSARTYLVGNVSEDIKKLVKVTEESLYEGIKAVKPGNRIGDIGYAVESYVKPYGYGVIRDYVGHGVGRKLHEDPQIPNYGTPSKGPVMRKNMTLAIEPMISLGDYRVEILEDNWTAVTLDKSPAAHFEHTVLVTDNGAEIITKL